ncbi:thiol:disulfide interchange protein DsbA/DsbL [Pseudothauera rhizosphaerae]|uniref:Thiol:disulfide interchange protein n=1 Tax=Pseudothauera rhizosphaerae TaxID=2565932 RepID=A0A4S4B2H8_9RHOO|nr:thiol:disulfide interchange protein DsbA/DsbL [Pseudothauera rhizosphaerae]THF65111.1 thiol:disulfide interchange protein DsbA/DsbL [Pseudothauera rhizosphaerae]
MNRRTALKQLAALGALASPAAGVLAQSSAYTVLNPAQPTDDPARIEVIKFFHYGCPHCANLAPLIHLWAKAQPQDVHFRHVPVVWNNAQLAGLARLYYTAEVSGDLETLHPQVFRAVQEQKLPLHTESGASAWIAGKVADPKRFMDAYKSFGVQSQVQRGNQLSAAMKISGVPTLVVEGKYLTASSMAGGHEGAIQVLDQLVARARSERSKG